MLIKNEILTESNAANTTTVTAMGHSPPDGRAHYRTRETATSEAASCRQPEQQANSSTITSLPSVLNSYENCHDGADESVLPAAGHDDTRAAGQENQGHAMSQQQQQQQQRAHESIRCNSNDCELVTKNGAPASENSDGDNKDFITLIHFNDCYNIESGPESSGAAGFLTAINQFRHLNPVILFSGDILSPSFMSTFTKGEQMIPVLNDIGVHCAVFGNHEFDYGVDNLIEFTRRTTFPWLLSNVIDKETSNQLGDGLIYHIIERQGLKLGLIGLIEEEWLSTLSTLDSSDVIYEDFVKRGRELARWLKYESSHRVDYVIALTHFRTPNDIRLADSVSEIDLILGGHDHDYEVIERPNCYVVKSGTDFREFSLIKLKLNAQYLEMKRKSPTDIVGDEETTVPPSLSSSSTTTTTTTLSSATIVSEEEPTAMTATTTATATSNGHAAKCEPSAPDNSTASRQQQQQQQQQQLAKPINEIAIKRIECLSYKPDPCLKAKLDKFVTSIDEKMGKVLGQFNCELDGRFSSIRRHETNLGNFVCDIMLASTHADLAILNSGTLRSDRVHPKGDFTMRDLFNILGYIDPIAVLQATGYHVWQALENGVSQWPKLEGRFPQVSGCSFLFDPAKPPLERIDPKDIFIGDEPLNLKKNYKLTTKAYLASGKDGYDCLKECKILVPGDESPDLTTSILNHFEAINILKSNRRTHHRQSLICLSRSSIRRLLDQNTTAEEEEEEDKEDEQQQDDDASEAGAGAVAMQTNSASRFVLNNNNNDNNNNNNFNNGNSSSTLPTTIETIGRRVSVESMQLECSSSANAGDNDGNSLYEASELSRKNSDAIGTLENRALQCLTNGPSASSPLVGMTAPTPSLGNLLQASASVQNASEGSCGGCGTEMATPPSVIPRRGSRQPRTKRMMSLYEMECEQCKLEPKIEGRIKILGVNYPPKTEDGQDAPHVYGVNPWPS